VENQNIRSVRIEGVNAATLPEANFTYFPEPPLAKQLVNFDASSSKPNGGNIISYRWDFGDETPVVIETDSITTHGYTEVGSYTVNLTVIDSEGLNDTKSKLITVLQQPIAIFTYYPEDLLVDDAVTFNAFDSKDEDGEIVSYAWDFGDEAPVVIETGPVTTHAYTTGGTYMAELTVTDNDNLTDTATIDVVVLVHDIAVIDLMVSQNTVEIGESVSISMVVTNEGNFSETFSVTIYYDDHVIETKSVTNLPTGALRTFDATWNTTEVSEDEYTIKAVASVVEGEKERHTDDNTYINGTVIITAEVAPPPNVFLYVVIAAAIIIVAIG